MVNKPQSPSKTTSRSSLDRAFDAAPENPCVRNCCLDNEDVCLGCFRHLDEILAWQGLNPQEKIAVLKTCDERRRHASR